MPPHLYAPPPALAPFVETLWAVERAFRRDAPPFAILPDSSVELVFSAGCPSWLDAGGGPRPAPACYLVGLLDRPVYLSAEGSLRTVAARFHAWGLLPLLGADLAGGGVRGLEQRWPARSAAITAALVAGELAAALALLEGLLLERAVALAAPPRPDPAAQALAGGAGGAGVGALAAAQHRSVRQLERGVRAAVGRSPKALARLARFQQARDRLFADPDQELAALAAELGYADQAHLGREFKAFSQRTPRQFAAEARATRTLLGQAHVAFVLDSAGEPGYAPAEGDRTEGG